MTVKGKTVYVHDRFVAPIARRSKDYKGIPMLTLTQLLVAAPTFISAGEAAVNVLSKLIAQIVNAGRTTSTADEATQLQASMTQLGVDMTAFQAQFSDVL